MKQSYRFMGGKAGNHTVRELVVCHTQMIVYPS
jgi:hypothetical protein